MKWKWGTVRVGDVEGKWDRKGIMQSLDGDSVWQCSAHPQSLVSEGAQQVRRDAGAVGDK